MSLQYIYLSKEKLVVDESFIGEEGDERLARVLVEIADTIIPGIKWEADWPSKNQNKKLPVLDNQIYMTEDFRIRFEFYQKSVSRKSVIHSESALSNQCKRSVHVQELLRRMLSCSKELDWKSVIVPYLQEYMVLMRQAQYRERYRREVLDHSIRIYKKFLEDEENNVRPMYRPPEWQAAARREQRRTKRTKWMGSEFMSAIFIPPSPGGELLKRCRRVAERAAERGVNMKILESGGTSVKQHLQKSNPLAKLGCDRADCPVDNPGRGPDDTDNPARGKAGNCGGSSCNYVVECECLSRYHGESNRTGYTRMLEEAKDYEMKKPHSFMRQHELEEHNGEEKVFKFKVTHTGQPVLRRQIREAVEIAHAEKTMNGKTEWSLPMQQYSAESVVRRQFQFGGSLQTVPRNIGSSNL